MHMRRLVGLMAVGAVGLGVGGCAKPAAAPAASAPAAAAEPAAAPVPADSPLAKVKVGMTEQEVRTILGPPTSENSYPSEKAFIPWYFGPDRYRRGYFYKGMGRLVISAGKVSRVEYDPAESGVAR